MPVLRNTRHEKFAQLCASGMLPMDAYRTLPGPKAKLGSSERVMSARLFAKVGSRIAELKAASATATTLTMRERREFLARCVRADLANFDTTKDGDLLQEITDTTTETGSTRKIKLPGKRECVMDDAKLAGELSEKVEHSGTLSIAPITFVMPETFVRRRGEGLPDTEPPAQIEDKAAPETPQ